MTDSHIYHIPPGGPLYRYGEEPVTSTIFLCGEKWTAGKHLMQERRQPANCTTCILIAFSKGIKIK